MPVSNKHSNAQRVFYAGFDGGLNLSVPSESLPKNELKEAVNVEFSPLTGSMKVRGGLVWSWKFDDEVDDVVPVQGRRGFLARRKETKELYYFRWNNIWPVTGELSGDGKLSIAHWMEKTTTLGGEEQEVDCWLIASGGQLQKFTDTPTPHIEDISNGPMRPVSEIKNTLGETIGFVCTSTNCHQVFSRNGRVVVVGDNDIICFSALGDCEN